MYSDLACSSMRYDLNNEIKKVWKKAPIIILAGICGVVAFLCIDNVKGTKFGKALLRTYIDVTGFRISHIILHLLIGFFLPDFLWLSFFISFGWELFESLISKYTDK